MQQPLDAPRGAPRPTMADNFVIAYTEWVDLDSADKSNFTEFAARRDFLGNGDGQFTCFTLWDMKPTACANLHYDLLDFDDGSIALRRAYGEHRYAPQWVVARPDERQPRRPC